jgi:hypothetical protein
MMEAKAIVIRERGVLRNGWDALGRLEKSKGQRQEEDGKGTTRTGENVG